MLKRLTQWRHHVNKGLLNLINVDGYFSFRNLMLSSHYVDWCGLWVKAFPWWIPSTPITRTIRGWKKCKINRIWWQVGWVSKIRLFRLNGLTTSKVISVQVPTCGSVQLWRLYSAATQGVQPTATMNQYPTQSHYPDTELTSPCPILVISNATLRSEKYQFCKPLAWLVRISNPPPSTWEACALQTG